MRILQSSLLAVLLCCALVAALPKPKKTSEAVKPEESTDGDQKGSARAKKQTTTVCLEIKGNQATHTDCAPQQSQGPQVPQQPQQIQQAPQSETYLIFPQEPQQTVSYVNVPVVHQHVPQIPQIVVQPHQPGQHGHPGGSGPQSHGSQPCDDNSGSSSAIIFPPGSHPIGPSVQGPSLQVVPQGPSIHISGGSSGPSGGSNGQHTSDCPDSQGSGSQQPTPGIPCPPCPCQQQLGTIVYRNSEAEQMDGGMMPPPMLGPDARMMMPPGMDMRSMMAPGMGPGPMMPLMMPPGMEMRSMMAPDMMAPMMMPEGMDARNHGHHLHHYLYNKHYGYNHQPYVIKCGPNGVSASTLPGFRSAAEGTVTVPGGEQQMMQNMQAMPNPPMEMSRSHSTPSMICKPTSLQVPAGRPCNEHPSYRQFARSADATEATEAAAAETLTEAAADMSANERAQRSEQSDKPLTPSERINLMRAASPPVQVNPAAEPSDPNVKMSVMGPGGAYPLNNEKTDEIHKRETGEILETSS